MMIMAMTGVMMVARVCFRLEVCGGVRDEGGGTGLLVLGRMGTLGVGHGYQNYTRFLFHSFDSMHL